MLRVRDLVVGYGAIQAVRGIDLDIEQGEIVALIGSNGAGKTTVARAIAGLLSYSGEILFEGVRLKPNAAERNLRLGIALVPEGRGILGTMTVQDNLLMGLYARNDKAQAKLDLAVIHQRFPILAQRGHLLASLMSGGEQQLLAIGRALLSKPKLLLLDEPSLGLSPRMTDTVFAMIEDLRRDGLTVLLVEQKARQTLQIADRAYLLETGCVITTGAAKGLIDDPVVSETFLGSRTAAVHR